MAAEEGEERLARRVSWMPGAEGAPFGSGVVVEEEVAVAAAAIVESEGLALERLVVVDGCEEEGIMRRDWEGVREC